MADLIQAYLDFMRRRIPDLVYKHWLRAGIMSDETYREWQDRGIINDETDPEYIRSTGGVEA